MNKDDYVNYELAIKLKDAGFDEPCDKWIASKSFSYYDEDECCDHNAVIRKGWLISQKQKDRYDKEALPYLSLWQAQKWLREKKGVFTWVMPDRQPIDDDFFNDEFTGEWWWDISSSEREILKDTYPSYESALSAGISAALELIKKGK